MKFEKKFHGFVTYLLFLVVVYTSRLNSMVGTWSPIRLNWMKSRVWWNLASSRYASGSFAKSRVNLEWLVALSMLR